MEQQLSNNIGIVAREFLKNFTKKTRTDGSQFWDLARDIDWQHNLVMEAYGERMLCPEAYCSVFKILVEVFVASNREEAEEFLLDIEPYANISDLTGWLNSDSANIDYLTKVINHHNPADGVSALSIAHRSFLMDVGQKLINGLQTRATESVMFEKTIN